MADGTNFNLFIIIIASYKDDTVDSLRDAMIPVVVLFDFIIALLVCYVV